MIYARQHATTINMKERVQNLQTMLNKCERNGADCHVLDNLRHQLALLAYLCEQEQTKDLSPMVRKVEQQVVEFFKARYGVRSEK